MQQAHYGSIHLHEDDNRFTKFVIKPAKQALNNLHFKINIRSFGNVVNRKFSE